MEFNNLERLRRQEFETAFSLAADSKIIAALNICWELLRKVDLVIYRRALSNLLVASIHHKPTVRCLHARECLDLLDLLKQQKEAALKEKAYNGKLEHIKALEENALRIVNKCSVATPNNAVNDESSSSGGSLLPEGNLMTECDEAAGYESIAGPQSQSSCVSTSQR